MVVIMGFEIPAGSTQVTVPLLIVHSNTQQGVTLAAYGILNLKERVFNKFKVEDIIQPGKVEHLRFLLLPTGVEEDRLIRITSDTCLLMRMGFLYWDMVLRMTPFAYTDDVTLFKLGEKARTARGQCLRPVSVSPTQILILILRECLDVANPVHAILKRLNSQTATADDLLLALTPSLKPVESTYIKSLTESYDHVHDRRDIYDCVLCKKF